MYGSIYYLIFMVPALIFALFAQIKVKVAYKKYSKVANSRGLTGAQAAYAVLRQYGITDVQIVPCRGKMTDNYNPETKTISLSEGVFNSTSISAIGIACHEAGHAAQHAEDYAPNRIRTALVPITKFGSRFGLIIALVGFFLSALTEIYFSSLFLIILGLALYGFTAVFSLVTLPVEFNASSRAINIIENSGLLYGEEVTGARKVLTAAALTYVAALASSILNLLYYTFKFLGKSRN